MGMVYQSWRTTAPVEPPVERDEGCPRGGEHVWRFLRVVETGYGKWDQFYCEKCRRKEADTQ